MTQGLDRLSVNSTVDGVEAVVNFQSESEQEPQPYHIRITPMADIELRQETIGERGDYNWGPEGPPPGITNAVRLNMKKEAQDEDLFDNAENYEEFIYIEDIEDPNELTQYAKHQNNYVRRLVADNSYTDFETLEYLATDQDFHVRINVADNHNTSLETLTQLAEDVDTRVSTRAIKNPNFPSELLKQYAEHSNASIRWAVAANPNTPQEILLMLSADENSDVSREALGYWTKSQPDTSAENFDWNIFKPANKLNMKKAI